MAEILIMARNNTTADPERERIGCYKRGMPVAVRPDGHAWGLEESKQAWLAAGRSAASWPGHFVIAKIPGVTVATVLALIEPQTEDDGGNALGAVYRRRRWKVDVDSIPSAIRQQLIDNGEVTVTANQIKNYVQRIRDGSVYSGL